MVLVNGTNENGTMRMVLVNELVSGTSNDTSEWY